MPTSLWSEFSWSRCSDSISFYFLNNRFFIFTNRQTTQLILETTKQLIHEKGCETLTMKDIMEGSGLSKGAIFHYVKSKDEIYAWVLKERNEMINKSFMGEVKQGGNEFEGPMEKIADMLQNLEDPQDVSNKVLKYLLGKEDQPAVAADVLHEFYEQTTRYSKLWILTGQQYGVIPATIDCDVRHYDGNQV